MPPTREILLRFALNYPVCALILWAFTGREWGGPGALAAAVFATLIGVCLSQPTRRSRQGQRGRIRPAPPRAKPPAAVAGRYTEISRQLSNPAWLRANGMMLTASLLDTLDDLDTYVAENRPPRPATPGPGVAFTYPCGCNVSALTKGGHIVIPCAQHRNGGAPSTVPALMGSRPGLTFEEFGSTEREPCGCILQTVGPAHATAPGAVRSVKYPCLQHQAEGRVVHKWAKPAETSAQGARAAEELDVMILQLGRSLDEALDRDHGTRRTEAR